MTSRPLLLIVEDDEPLRTRLARAFDERGFEVAQAATTEDAERWLEGDAPEFVLLDLRVPTGGGLPLVALFKQADPNTRIVVLTGYGSIATAVEATKRGATQYLTKPADADQILAAFGAGAAAGGDGPDDGEAGVAAGAGAGAAAPAESATAMSLDRVEWEHINRVLTDAGGNISEAARILGLHRRSLQRKLNRYPPRQ